MYWITNWELKISVTARNSDFFMARVPKKKKAKIELDRLI
jgi:hypothetical protein